MKKYHLLACILFSVILSSCKETNLDNEFHDRKLLNTLADSPPLGTGSLSVSFDTDKAVMGYSSNPILYFDPLATIDHSKLKKVYIFGSVSSSPNITVDDSSATAGSNTFLLYEADALSDLHNVYFNAPGFWHLKAVVLYDGNVFYSDELEMEIWYPSVFEMEGDPDLISEMNSLWEKTLNAASSSSRQELGFWIYAYIDSSNELRFSIGEEEEGPEVSGCEGTQAGINRNHPSITNPLADAPDDTGIEFAVGYFHTHTTMHYCPYGTSRPTGPSPGDEDVATDIVNPIPVLLYDFSSSTIYGGHPLNDSYQLYYVEEVEKRETPTYWIGN